MTTDNGSPAVPAAPDPNDPPAPEAPKVEEDRIGRIEASLEKLANVITQGMSRETPPTADDSQALAEARQLQERLTEEAKTNPAVQTALTISQALYNKMQNDHAVMQARLDLAEIEDPEEKKATKKRWESGDYRTVEAARDAAQRDLPEKQPAPKVPDPDKQREEVERVRGTDASPRGVSAPNFRKRMDTNEYVSKVGDRTIPIEERVKLRHEKEGITSKK